MMERQPPGTILPELRPLGLLRRMIDFLMLCDERHRERQALRRLDARLRMDIGLRDEHIREELGRPLWDPPPMMRH